MESAGNTAPVGARLMRNRFFAPILCALIAFLIYSPALKHEFVWDDSIIQTLQLPFIKTVKDAFAPPPGMIEYSGAYYRPLVLLSYLADKSINSALLPANLPRGPHDPAKAAIPHATTLLFHAATAAAVMLLARRVLRGRKGGEWGALGAGLFFALHPIHAETAASITGRSDSMATFFLLAGILATLEARDRKSLPLLAATAILWLLAFMSKEVSFVGLALLPLTMLLAPADKVEEQPQKAAKGAKPKAPAVDWLFWLKHLAPALAAFCAYFAMRLTLNIKVTVAANSTLPGSAGNVLRAFGFYLSNAFIPWPLSPYIPNLPGNLETGIWLFVGALAIAGAVVLYTRGDKLYLACLAWFFAGISPSLYVVLNRITDAMAAQRYLYLPSVGLSLAFGCLLATLISSRFKNYALGVAASLLVSYGGLSLAGSTIWHSDLTLWSELTKRPETSRYALPWVNLGNAYLELERKDDAEKAFWQVLKSDVKAHPEDKALAYNGIGGVHYTRGMDAIAANRHREAYPHFGQAQKFYEFAQTMGINDYTINNNLARAYLQRAWLNKVLQGSYDTPLLDSARRQIAMSLRLSPGNPDAMTLRQEIENHAKAAQ